jgi:hypothetical protein
LEFNEPEKSCGMTKSLKDQRLPRQKVTLCSRELRLLSGNLHLLKYKPIFQVSEGSSLFALRRMSSSLPKMSSESEFFCGPASPDNSQKN